jgi:ribosome maturation factor RimP
MSLIDKMEKVITPVLESEKMELVDLQLTKESGRRLLRVFFDKEGGVTLGDCVLMSDKLGTVLEENPETASAYDVLEMSSPGIDRVLKKEKDFIRFVGKKAKVTVFAPINGQRNFLGRIAAVSGGEVTIDDVTGKTVVIPIDKMASSRLEPELDF